MADNSGKSIVFSTKSCVAGGAELAELPEGMLPRCCVVCGFVAEFGYNVMFSVFFRSGTKLFRSRIPETRVWLEIFGAGWRFSAIKTL